MNTPSTISASPVRPRWLIVAVLVLVSLLAGGAGGYVLASHNQHGDQSANADLHAMNTRAAHVMGFDLNSTTHMFTKTADGGVEQVVANDPADQRNTALIRAHLQKEADKFSQGDYSDPATIHGTDMPGLAELQAGAGRVQVLYEQVPNGARINYRSADPVLIAALHAWFDRQITDHAMPGMGMGH